MAAITLVSSIIVPEIFAPYIQQRSMEMSAILQSGAAVQSDYLNTFLDGGGLMIHVPSFKDLDQDGADSSIVADDTAGDAVPRGIGTAEEIAVRLSRSQGWESSDLAAALSGEDPLQRIMDLVSSYWTGQSQRMFIATMTGVFADNAAAPAGLDTHLIGDLTFSLAAANAGVFGAGITNFNAGFFIDAQQTMGDASSGLSMVLMHSVVYANARKNNLIDFMLDSDGKQIPTYMGLRVIIDDMMPFTGGLFETWLFGPGAVLLANGIPKVPVETIRLPAKFAGSGSEQLWSRLEWACHPVGYAFVGAGIAKGGPSNAQLAAAASWSRRYAQRKQIRIARLITREF